MKCYLEITNVCNLRCSFCPGTRREKRFVEPAVFARRLAALQGVADEFYLHVLGEPLLHPGFAEIVGICRAAGAAVNLTTNGTLLDGEKAGLLLGAPFRQVNFSLQALMTERGADEAALERILDFCRRATAEAPELYCNLRLWNLDGDFGGAERNRKVLEAIGAALGCPMPEHFSAGRKSRRLTGRIYLNCDSRFDWPDGVGTERSCGCYGLRNQFAVLAGGELTPCCLDAEGVLTLGNVDREEPARILDSERARGIREGFVRGEAVEPFCRSCSFKNRFA